MKYYLNPDQTPKQYYNIQADLTNRPLPPLHPGTKQPVGPADLAPLFRGTRWYRRLWAVMWGGALAVWIGAVIATIVGLGASWLVIRLTDMLRT